MHNHKSGIVNILIVLLGREETYVIYHFSRGFEKKAIKITKKTAFFDPLFRKTKTSLTTDAFSVYYKRRYSLKNGILSFIDEKKNWYVIPCLKGSIETLKLSGYTRASFYVPCTDGRSFPVNKEKEWNYLLAQT